MNTRLDIHISLSTSDCLLSLLSQAFESTAMLSLIKRGETPYPAFLIYRMICLSWYTPSSCKLTCKVKPRAKLFQGGLASRDWVNETKHQRSLRGLIELWPHHDLRTKRNETDHYHYLDNLITQILNKFIMLGSCINISCSFLVNSFQGRYH